MKYQIPLSGCYTLHCPQMKTGMIDLRITREGYSTSRLTVEARLDEGNGLEWVRIAVATANDVENHVTPLVTVYIEPFIMRAPSRYGLVAFTSLLMADAEGHIAAGEWYSSEHLCCWRCENLFHVSGVHSK